MMRQARILAIVALLGVAVFFRGELFSGMSPKEQLPRATNSELAVSNLNSQIVSLEQLVSRFPEQTKFRSQLLDLLALRVQFLGAFDDLGRMDELSSGDSASVEALLMRARYLSAVHEFAAAAALLERARATDPANRAVAHQLRTIRIALREGLPELRQELAEAAQQTPSYSTLLQLAAVESELGRYEDADRSFERALTAYRDTLPFPIAYIFFQRGVMWAEKAGMPEKAKRYYEHAVRYLPEYVVAQVHLAELRLEDGESAAAEKGLRKVLESGDPEPLGLLAELYESQKRDGGSFVQAARAKYDVLLKRYPLAFADHGAEFFSGPGADPARALSLAKANVMGRKTERAYIVAIDAAVAAERMDEACSFAAEARALNPVFVPLKEQLAKLSCPDSAIS